MHRLVGVTSFTLMVGHIGLILLGYAAASPTGLWATLWTTSVEVVLDEPGMLLAVAGTAALVLVVVTSARRARRRLRYESWHLIHLYGYLGAALALPHQLWTGADFVGSSAATVFWWTLYAVCAGSVLVWRLALPAWRAWRYPVYATQVEETTAGAGAGAVSVTVQGAGVQRMRAASGQFFQWRFLDGPGWTRAHPYSLSAAPDGSSLRFTAAVVGDGTARLRELTPGTRVALEGPYGRLHAGVRTRCKVVLMGSGIGITPMLALLQGLDVAPGEVTVIHRVRSAGEAILADELRAEAESRGASYVLLEGHRIGGRTSWLPEYAAAWSDAQALTHLVPDVADRDLYVCGAPAWMDAVTTAARAAGTAAGQIHRERFSV